MSESVSASQEHSVDWKRRAAIGVAGIVGCVGAGGAILAWADSRTDTRRQALTEAVQPKVRGFKDVALIYETPDHLTDNTIAVIDLQDGRTCRVEYSTPDGEDAHVEVEYLGDCPRVTPAP